MSSEPSACPALMTKQARILPHRALLVLIVLIYNPRGFAWLEGETLPVNARQAYNARWREGN